VLAGRVLSLSVEQLVVQFPLAFEEAQTLGVARQIYVRMAQAFNLKKVYVCDINLRDGLIAEVSSGRGWSDEFVDQILHSAHELGRRYQVGEAHAACVAENAMKLFDVLAPEHRLAERYRVILNAASWLHDIGMFIRNTSHHKHSQYIIGNSDIFGLSKSDIQLVALVARYHRRAAPKTNHSEYQALPRDQRSAVAQLASILRVADALDRSHTQMLNSAVFKLKNDQLIVESKAAGECASEKRALATKGQMFEGVYGRTIVMSTSRKKG
jgi:exopolyphosphatase/guanosine-5'-triphosphate,3'-diphosphate pyrophosphatase